jgi:DNA polymerase family B
MAKRHIHRDFVGVDGEGGNIRKGDPLSHEYLLLRAGDQTLETGIPLTAYECLAFIANLPWEREYAAYFFDYDVTMICRGLPEERIRRLLDREGRTPAPDSPRAGLPPLPVDVGPFQIDYLPHKEFRVRWRPTTGQRTDVPWVIISDTGTFFQTAFLKTIERWGIGTDETRALIAKGKEQRADFAGIDDEIRYYNGLEIEHLEDLMTQFRQTCVEVGYVPRVWQGPGNLATAMLAKHGIPRTQDLPDIPSACWGMAQNAYYGGRFETTAVGPVAGPVFQYDINSAYPWACTLLPCLIHGRWRLSSNPKGLYVGQVRFSGKADQTLYPFPVRRKDGSIHFPRYGAGWYWSPEIEAAQRSGTKVTLHGKCWEYVKECECEPFSWIPDVYLERIRLGKAARGLVLKLALNSLYGKFAQSIGAAPYANPIYAGLITSLTRAKLIDAYSANPSACFMLATDGIFTGLPIELNTSTALGDWDLKVHDDGMFIIQPGLYFAGEEKPKTRGVPMGKVLERREEFEKAWNSSDWARLDRTPGNVLGPAIPSVRIPMRQFIGLRLAYARNAPETAGQWLEVGSKSKSGEWIPGKEISFDWSTKRRPLAVRRDRWGLRTSPYLGNSLTVTVPYERDIGGNMARAMERLQWEDAPDWADGLRDWE